MCLYGCWLFTFWCLLLGLSKLLDETHRAALETALESSARTSVDEIHELLGREVKKGIEVYSTVLKSAESTLGFGLFVGLEYPKKSIELIQEGS